MRYHNPKSGLDIDLGPIDAEKRRLFDTAQEKFRKNTNWFEFEQLVFTYTSPIFSRAKNRADVVNEPLFHALKDMWLQLGIDQGFIANDRTETKARPAGPHRPARRGDVAAARQPAVPRRRGR
jgi:hypothetical protein